VLGKLCQRVHAIAEMLIIVGEICCLANQCDRQGRSPPSLADPSVENRCFLARVGADKQDCVSVLDAIYGGIEQVACPSMGRIECRTVGPTIEIRRTERVHKALEREHFLHTRQIAG
jgi:hypothetical protein